MESGFNSALQALRKDDTETLSSILNLYPILKNEKGLSESNESYSSDEVMVSSF